MATTYNQSRSFVTDWEKVFWNHRGKLIAVILVTQLLVVHSSPLGPSNNEAEKPTNQHYLQRVARALVTGHPPCPVSLDRLNRLRNEINMELTKLNPRKKYDSVDSDSSKNLSNCETLVNLIKSGTDAIRKRFVIAISGGAQSVRGSKLKDVIRILAAKFGIETNYVNDSLSQEYQQTVQHLLYSLNLLSQLVHDLENQQKEVTRGPCAAEAESGSDCCVNLNDKSQSFLADFVKRAYEDHGKQNNVENILQFAVGLPWLSQRAVVYKGLFEEMGKHRDLSNPQIVVLANKVEESVNKYINSSCETAIGLEAAQETKISLQALKNNITFYSNKVIESWTASINNSNYQSLDRLDEILKFTESLNNVDNLAVGYSSLFEAMKTNKHLDSYHLLTLAYGVKRSMALASNQTSPQGAQDKLANIKSNLPPSVSDLIWSEKSCRIKNRKHGETLYAAVNDFNHDKDRRKVFTWVPEDAEDADWKFVWKFETKDNGKSFRIKNSGFNNEYLFASADSKNAERRWVFTWIPKEAVDEEYWKKWRVIPVDNGKFFQLFNLQFGEYLYADGDMSQGKDNDRRGVYTWVQDKPAGFLEEESHWEIKC